MTYGADHTITTWVVSCWCGWQTYAGSHTISHVCARPEEPT